MNSFIVIINILLFCVNITNEQFLLFPVTAPTRVQVRTLLPSNLYRQYRIRFDQIITGIGFPVDLELESVTLGYVFKAEYWLPVNASNYLDILGDPFNPTPLPITRRRREANQIDGNSLTKQKNETGYDSETRQKYEKYDVEAEVITYDFDHPAGDDDQLNGDEDKNEIDDKYPNTLEDLKIKQPNNLDTARWTIYKGIETLAET